MSSLPDANAVASGLQAEPAAVADEQFDVFGEDLPAEPGFYAWWAPRNALPRVPTVPNPIKEYLTLLYVGISPARPSSRGTIRSRVKGNHLRGNVGSSTFRFILAALLVDELELRPFMRGAKIALPPTANKDLSEWMQANLHLTTYVRPEPWMIEDAVVARLGPPLNSAGNSAHPFRSQVRAARTSFRERAKTAAHRLD
jgi:hypothetical protein